MNRLTSIASGPTEYVYQYNAANRFWSGGIPVEGQRFGYSFDDIGNRTETSRNGRLGNYEPNLLNQIVEREVRGAVDIMGHAHPEAFVTVNLKNATRQDGGYFHREVLLDNDGQAAQEEIRVVGVRNAAGPNGEDVVSELTGETFLPADPEIFSYDDDGNLLGDGRWTYEWDAENRLVAMETRLELSSVLPCQRLEFGYYWQGRRIQKTVMEFDGSWQVVADCYSHYRGWNLVAELDETVLKSYLWGLDLSGTLEGAGGVGGLLAIRDHVGGDVFYPVSDGNGNVTGLIDSTDATVAAIYEYGPFGEAIRASGPAAELNPFRFSTKYWDVETELPYYGYRYYSPEMGRWLNRDPIGEVGGTNLYAMISNNPVNYWDYLGLAKSCEDIINSPEFQTLPPNLQAEILKACGPPQVICPGCAPGPGHGPGPAPSPGPSPDRGPNPGPDPDANSNPDIGGCCDFSGCMRRCMLREGAEILWGEFQGWSQGHLLKRFGFCMTAAAKSAAGKLNPVSSQASAAFGKCLDECWDPLHGCG